MINFLEKEIKRLQGNPKGDDLIVCNSLEKKGFKISSIYDFLNFNIEIEGSQEILLDLLERKVLSEVKIIRGVLYSLSGNRNSKYHKRILEVYLKISQDLSFGKLKYECYCLFKKKCKKADHKFETDVLNLIKLELKNSEFLEVMRLIESLKKIGREESLIFLNALLNETTDKNLKKTITNILDK